MANSGNNNQDNQNSNTGISSSELAVIGAIITTIGDAISLIAALQ